MTQTGTSEFERIERIRSILDRHCDRFTVANGDDATLLQTSGKPLALSVDASVEGKHFRREHASWEEIGARAHIAAVSDLAAMGAEPTGSLVALISPRDFEAEQLEALARGIAAAADQTGAYVVGGNLAQGDAVSITTTVFGFVPDRALARSGARPGDSVFITGHVGSAALGFALLERGAISLGGAEPFVQAWRRPPITLAISRRVRELATAAIDVSDGLIADLHHLCSASAVGATVFTSELPLAPNFTTLAARLGEDALRLACTGGEDYGLLFTAPADESLKKLATRIGHITDRHQGVQVRTPDGESLHLDTLGFLHFPPAPALPE